MEPSGYQGGSWNQRGGREAYTEKHKSQIQLPDLLDKCQGAQCDAGNYCPSTDTDSRVIVLHPFRDPQTGNSTGEEENRHGERGCLHIEVGIGGERIEIDGVVVETQATRKGQLSQNGEDNLPAII